MGPSQITSTMTQKETPKGAPMPLLGEEPAALRRPYLSLPAAASGFRWTWPRGSHESHNYLEV